MRPPRRFLLSRFGIIFSLLAVFSGPALAQTPSPANPPDQQTQPAQAAPAAQAQIPAKWNDAVHSLAEKIASAAAPSHKISLELKNISSLSSTEASAIRQELEYGLNRRHLRITAPSSAEAQVNTTLSEGIQGYVWSAQIQHGGANKIVLLAVPKESSSLESKPKGSLTLDARLIWEQPERFLDFKLFVDPVGAFSTLVILNPEEFAFYRSAESGWQLWRTIRIPHSEPWSRDLRGGFGLDASRVDLPGVECSGDFETAKIECHPWKETTLILAVGPNLPGLDGVAGAALWKRCGDSSIALMSGKGDWTQPDTLQGYLFTDYRTEAVRSGSPVGFEGPVVEIYREGKESAARAVVRNLKTGDYEAYLVSATCSH